MNFGGFDRIFGIVIISDGYAMILYGNEQLKYFPAIH